MNRIVLSLFGIILSTIIFFSCQSNDYVPKPMAYFRIDFPEKSYRVFDSAYPYSFEYPVYANIQVPEEENESKRWLNVVYPHYKGKIYLSYRPVKNNLDTLIDDCWNFVNRHIPKASGIDPEIIQIPKKRIFGQSFTINGQGVASPYQFYLTDSLHHFLRGALYFETNPNNDSLQPVIDFIKQDINHLIQTCKWKKL